MLCVESFVGVRYFGHTLRWYYVTDAEHMKQRYLGAFSSVGFLSRKRNGQTNMLLLSAMVVVVVVVLLLLLLLLFLFCVCFLENIAVPL